MTEPLFGPDAPVEEQVEKLLLWVLDSVLGDHEHLLAARRQVDPGDNFTCPLCDFRDDVAADLRADGPPPDLVEWLTLGDQLDFPTPENADLDPGSRDDLTLENAHLTLARDEDLGDDDPDDPGEREALTALTEEWLSQVLWRTPWQRDQAPPSAEDLAVNMRHALPAVTDKTLPADEAISQFWAHWTIHAMEEDPGDQNITVALSRGPYVGLVRTCTAEFGEYTRRGVPPVPWPDKTAEERMAILRDSVRNSLFETSVPALLQRARHVGSVTTPDPDYAERVRAFNVRVIKSAFPDGTVPPETGDPG